MDNVDEVSRTAPAPGAGEGDAISPVVAPSPAASGEADPMDLLPAVTKWLAGHHQMPYARAAVLRNVPADYASRGEDMLPRMLANVGLQASLVKRKLKAIPDAVLPCVVFAKDGMVVPQGLVLDGLHAGERKIRTGIPIPEAAE